MESLAKNLAKHKNVLKILSTKNNKLNKSILAKADRSLLHTICEISDNILNGKIKLNNSEFAHLKKYKHFLRKIIKRSGLKQKKQLQVYLLY